MRQTTRLQAEDGFWIETRRVARPYAEAAAIAEAPAAPVAGALTRAGGGLGIGAPVQGPAILWGEEYCGDITATARL